MPAKLKEALSWTHDETHGNDLAAQVRRRVQYDHMTYVGICGGASMAGSPATCVYGCGLDLLQGLEVWNAWDFNDANTIGNRLSFTYGCAFAVVLRTTVVAAVCFPVVKNAGRWWDYAAANSQLLLRIVQRLGNEWKEFATANGYIWFFNLRGYYVFSDCKTLHSV